MKVNRYIFTVEDKIKTMKYYISILLLVTTFAAQAQDLNEILENYYRANGSEKMADVNTMKMTAVVNMQGMQMEQDLLFKRPKKMRSEMLIMGQDMTMIYDGETAYMKMPGSSNFSIMPKEQGAGLVKQSDFDGALYNYEEKGNKVEYKGEESIDGQKYYLLQVTQKGLEDMPSIWLINASTYMLKYQRTKLNIQGMSMDGETEMVDYKDINGVKIPTKIVTRASGMQMMSMEVKDVEFNVEIEDSLFVVE